MENMWPWLWKIYSFEVGGSKDTADVREISDEQTEDLSWSPPVMGTDLLQAG